jgi:hypothetical protein
MSKMNPVTSSTILEVGYNDKTENLVIRFKSKNSLYVYQSVKPDMYKDFLNASSLGTFFAQQIKNSYSTIKISENELQGYLGKPARTAPVKKVDYLSAAKHAAKLSNKFHGAAAFF